MKKITRLIGLSALFLSPISTVSCLGNSSIPENIDKVYNDIQKTIQAFHNLQLSVYKDDLIIIPKSDNSDNIELFDGSTKINAMYWNTKTTQQELTQHMENHKIDESSFASLDNTFSEYWNICIELINEYVDENNSKSENIISLFNDIQKEFKKKTETPYNDLLTNINSILAASELMESFIFQNGESIINMEWEIPWASKIINFKKELRLTDNLTNILDVSISVLLPAHLRVLKIKNILFNDKMI